MIKGANIMDFKGKPAVDEEAARLAAADPIFDFERAVLDKLHQLQELVNMQGGRVPLKIDGRLVFVASDVIFEGLRDRVWKGMAILDFEDDGQAAVVIPLKRSIKPKRPKSTLETIRAMPVRPELSPEEREERRVKLEEMKAERQHQREKQLAFLRSEYGEDQAQAYAALMGWR